MPENTPSSTVTPVVPPPNTPLITGTKLEFFSTHGGTDYREWRGGGGDWTDTFEPRRNWNFPDVKVRAGYIRAASIGTGGYNSPEGGTLTLTVSGALNGIEDHPDYNRCSTHNENRHKVINYVRSYLCTKGLFTAGPTTPENPYILYWKPTETQTGGSTATTWKPLRGTAKFTQPPQNTKYADYFTLAEDKVAVTPPYYTATVANDYTDDLRTVLRYIADNILYTNDYQNNKWIYKRYSHTYNSQEQYEKTDWGKFYDNEGNVLKQWAELVLAVVDVQTRIYKAKSRKADVSLKKYKLRELWMADVKPIPGSGLKWNASFKATNQIGPGKADVRFTVGPSRTNFNVTTSDVDMHTLYGIEAAYYKLNTFCCNEGDFLHQYTFLKGKSFSYKQLFEVIMYDHDKPSLRLPEYIQLRVGEEVHKTLAIQFTQCVIPEKEFFEYKLINVDGHPTSNWGRNGLQLLGPLNEDCGLSCRVIMRESVLGGGRSYPAGIMLEGIAAKPGLYWCKVGLQTAYSTLENVAHDLYAMFFAGGYNEEFIVVYIRPTDYRPGDLVACIPSSIYQVNKHHLAVAHAELTDWEFQEHIEDDTPEGEWHYSAEVWDNKYPAKVNSENAEMTEFNKWMNEQLKELGISSNASGGSSQADKPVSEYIGEAHGRTHRPGYWYKAHNQVLTIYRNGQAIRSDHIYCYVITRDADNMWRLYCASSTEWHLASWRILAEATDPHGSILTDIQPPMYWSARGGKLGMLCLRGSECFNISKMHDGAEYEPLDYDDVRGYGGVYSYVGTFESDDDDPREVFQRQPQHTRIHDFIGRNGKWTNEDKNFPQTSFINNANRHRDTLLFDTRRYLYQKDIAEEGESPNIVWLVANDLSSINTPGIEGSEHMVKVDKARSVALPYNPMRPAKFIGGQSTSNVGDVGFLLETGGGDAAYAPMSISNWSGEGWGNQRYANPLGLFAKQVVSIPVDTSNSIVETVDSSSMTFRQATGGMIWHHYPMLRGKNLETLRAKCRVNGIDQAYGSWANCPFGPEVGYTITKKASGYAGGKGSDDDYGLPSLPNARTRRLLATPPPGHGEMTTTKTIKDVVINALLKGDFTMTENDEGDTVWSNGYIVQGSFTVSKSVAVKDDMFAAEYSSTTYDEDLPGGKSETSYAEYTLSNLNCTCKLSFFGVIGHAPMPEIVVDPEHPDDDPVATNHPTQFNNLHIKAEMRWTGTLSDGRGETHEYVSELTREWDTNAAQKSDGTSAVDAYTSDERHTFSYDMVATRSEYTGNYPGEDDKESRHTAGNCELIYVTDNITGRSNRAEAESGIVPQAMIEYPLLADTDKKATYSITDDGITSTLIQEGDDANEAYSDFRSDLESVDYGFGELDFPGYDTAGNTRHTDQVESGTRVDSTLMKLLQASIVLNYVPDIETGQTSTQTTP